MKGMSVIVKTIASWVKVLIILFGIYIVLFGHLTPGGGFAGGVILAASYVLLMLAFGKEFVHKNLPLSLSGKLDSVGAILFLSIAVFGVVFGGGVFFKNFLVKYGQEFNLISAGTIPLSNLAIGLKVGASLYLVIFLLSAFRRDESEDEKELD
jgi:multicomponent Na+:H+ antiporter subunit B